MLSEYDHQGFGESSASPLSIAGGEGEVLPRLTQPALRDLLRRLPGDELREALRTRILRAVSLPGVVFHAACGGAGVRLAREQGLGLLGYAETADFLKAARSVHRVALLREATSGLARRWPMLSASRRMTEGQCVALLLCVVLTAAAAWLMPLHLFLAVASALSGIFFLAVVALRILCFMPRLKRAAPAMAEIADADWPVYSVLVPLFREVAVLDQLTAALRPA